MKFSQLIIALSVIGLMAGAPALSAAGGFAAADSYFARQGGQQNQPLSDEEAAMLTFMREEEKLARDVYLVMFDEWANPVFSNISRSEQQHMDTMKKMLVKHGLPDPVGSNDVGEFEDAELSDLYAFLIDEGLKGSVEALYVGALIEEVDMEDIQLAIDGTDRADLIRAYENLMRGSRNHLRAFVGQIESLGEVYEAQVLHQSVVDAIVDSPVERMGAVRGGR